MLGPSKPRRLDEPVAVSLEDLVPPGNFYRHLEANLDLGFVREWVRGLYAERGRPSIDPVVFFKLQLVMFFEGLRSERRLIETASLHLAHRWYLGYALDEALPDHSSLTRIRQRLGVEVFARFFERVVDLCQDAGLVWGRELFFDATKVRANAALDSLVPRFYHEATTHVADLFADDRAPEDDPGPAPDGGVLHLPATEGQPEATDPPEPEPRWKLLEERRLDPHRPSVEGYRRTTDYRVSPTDPDATPMQTRNGTALGYHDHYVVDGGKTRIVLAALVTPADVMENAPMRDLLWRTCFRRKLRPHHVTADTTYGTVENVVAVEDAGIRAYLPLPDWGSRRPQFFAQADFTFDAERDAYRCPEGQTLRRDTAKFADEVVVYRAEAAACNACPVKAACTD
jgi:transposase